MLRRDDTELKRLEEVAAAAKQANADNEANARRAVARVNAQNEVQARIEQMNKEGNKLVGEFTSLTEKSNDPSLSADAQAYARALAQRKLAEIQAKKAEIAAFIAAARAAGTAVDQTARAPYSAGEGEALAHLEKIKAETPLSERSTRH